MNIWHDIDEDRIFPTDFMSVIEISKGSIRNMNWTRKPGCCHWIGFFLRQHTIL